MRITLKLLVPALVALAVVAPPAGASATRGVVLHSSGRSLQVIGADGRVRSVRARGRVRPGARVAVRRGRVRVLGRARTATLRGRLLRATGTGAVLQAADGTSFHLQVGNVTLDMSGIAPGTPLEVTVHFAPDGSVDVSVILKAADDQGDDPAAGEDPGDPGDDCGCPADDPAPVTGTVTAIDLQGRTFTLQPDDANAEPITFGAACATLKALDVGERVAVTASDSGNDGPPWADDVEPVDDAG